MKHRFDIDKPMQVGGQAVIEGVMMRAPGMVATAVRRPDGTIVVQKAPFVSFAEKNRFFQLMILRGAVGLIEMLTIGIRTLNFSAEAALDVQPNDKPKKGSSKEGMRLGLTVAFALVAGGALFFVIPLIVTSSIPGVEQNPLVFNLIAGGIRVFLLLSYLWLISLLKDVQRLFAYHGAEHKAVFAFETGEELSVRAAMRQSRFHPRCGTSFILIVMVSSIVLFALLDALLIRWLGALNVVIRISTHLPLLPLVGGLSYEIIRASARNSATPLGRMIVAPGLWMQNITTKEPDEGQMEVALAALRAALGEDTPVSSALDSAALLPISLN
jgi:uncharacterized protein YqhQ